MPSRLRWILMVGLICAFALVFTGTLAWLGGAWAWWVAPKLTGAVDAPADSGRVSVGKTVPISTARAKVPHYGCTMAADPTHADRLFVASNPVLPGPSFAIIGYYSHDGGATWQLGCERTGKDRDERCCDEALAYAPDGTLVLAHMRGDYGNENTGVMRSRVDFLRSGDGGKTWEEGKGIEGWVDRPQIAFDLTDGPHRGRLYCNANEAVIAPGVQRAGAGLAYVSSARVFAAETLGARLLPAALPERELLTAHNSNPVVLVDGTVVVAYQPSATSMRNPNRIAVWRSFDGGRSFLEASRVPTNWVHPTARSQGNLMSWFPRLAAGPDRLPGESAAAKTSPGESGAVVAKTSPGESGAVAAKTSPGPGPLYCVWDDGRLVLFSSSTDRGDTWSAPVLLSEQSLDLPANELYEAGMPVIAANHRGEIAVAWFDRRGLPPSQVDANQVVHKSGYNFRLRASRDGGRTWTPSVSLNEKPGRGDPLELRGWGVGMAADAKGVFHPAWVSDCDGVQQLWTAAVALGQVP